MFKKAYGLSISAPSAFGGKSQQRQFVFLQPLRNLRQSFGNDGGLLIPAVVDTLFPHGQRTIFERDDNSLSFVVASDLLDNRQEEPFAALDVVLLDACGPQLEMHRDAVRSKGIIMEVFGVLNVILIPVGPVQKKLFAVIGNGVTLTLRIATLRDEVSILIVTTEKSVQVIEYRGFKRFAIANARRSRFYL